MEGYVRDYFLAGGSDFQPAEKENKSACWTLPIRIMIFQSGYLDIFLYNHKNLHFMHTTSEYFYFSLSSISSAWLSSLKNSKLKW